LQNEGKNNAHNITFFMTCNSVFAKHFQPSMAFNKSSIDILKMAEEGAQW
jgi:hypothetical protein